MPEALIATAIAAAVLTAAASAIGAALRLNHASTERSLRLDEAKIITTRLRAGFSDREALEGFPDWRLERRPFEDDALNRHAAHFDIVAISHGDDGAIAIDLLTPRAEAPE